MAARSLLPARRDHLLVQELGDEIVVVDTATQRAHSLTGLVADVFRASANGVWWGDQTDEFDAAVAELVDAGLLAEPRGLSRRRLLQGAGAAVVVGGVASIGLPAVEAAASPGPSITYTTPCQTNTLHIAAGLHVIDFTIVGGGGGGGAGGLNTTIISDGGNGANAGVITGQITVTGPTTLTVVVGGGGNPGIGTAGAQGGSQGGAPGCGTNTGGAGGAGGNKPTGMDNSIAGGGGGGGGETIVTTPSGAILLIAGGGGGGGGASAATNISGGNGGAGNGTTPGADGTATLAGSNGKGGTNNGTNDATPGAGGAADGSGAAGTTGTVNDSTSAGAAGVGGAGVTGNGNGNAASSGGGGGGGGGYGPGGGGAGGDKGNKGPQCGGNGGGGGAGFIRSTPVDGFSVAATPNNIGDVADGKGLGGLGGKVLTQVPAAAGTDGLARFMAAGLS